MRYRAVLFDVDGTIVDSQRAVLKAFEKVLGELGLPAPDAQLKESALRGPGLRVLEGLGVKNAKEVGLRWGEYCAQEEKQLFPGIARVLRELRRAGVQLGIVTSRTACETEMDPPVKSVLPMFDARVCAGETSRPKPAPDPVLLCLHRLGARAEETLYIGDSPTDQQSALAAGVDFALAVWGARDTSIHAKYFPQCPEDVLSIAQIPVRQFA